MERREPVDKEGKRWQARAAVGRVGIGREAVWVECMVVPSGKRTERGWSVG
jgi:hypothetical protein